MEYITPIRSRDWNRCILCGGTQWLHEHHIETRGSWGTDDRYNLVTLCAVCHATKAHWSDLLKYKQIFKQYTAQFPRPANRDDIMKKSAVQWESMNRYKRKVAKKAYQEKKALQDKYKPEKSQYQYQKEKFVEKHWMSPRKYQYQLKKKNQKKRLVIREKMIKMVI